MPMHVDSLDKFSNSLFFQVVTYNDNNPATCHPIRTWLSVNNTSLNGNQRYFGRSKPQARCKFSIKEYGILELPQLEISFEERTSTAFIGGIIVALFFK